MNEIDYNSSAEPATCNVHLVHLSNMHVSASKCVKKGFSVVLQITSHRERERERADCADSSPPFHLTSAKQLLLCSDDLLAFGGTITASLSQA